MRDIKLILTFATFYFGFSAFSQTPNKPFIGTWKVTEADERQHSVTEGTWLFKNSSSGVWDRKLILSNSAVICYLKNSFTWKVAPPNKIKITLGNTSCKCIPSEKRFENGLEDFVRNLKASYNNEFFWYKYKVANSSTIYFDDLKLIKQ